MLRGSRCTWGLPAGWMSPSSCASAAHSGSQVKTLSAAVAGQASAGASAASKTLRAVFMGSSERVRAMRAQAHDVLKEDLVVRLVHARVVASELQPNPAE